MGRGVTPWKSVHLGVVVGMHLSTLLLSLVWRLRAVLGVSVHTMMAML